MAYNRFCGLSFTSVQEYIGLFLSLTSIIINKISLALVVGVDTIFNFKIFMLV